MDIILQKRIDVIKENNTAQETLESIVNKLKPSITELTVQTPLYGNLDLGAVLGSKFHNLRVIRFSPGEITDVRNIPTGITHFECPGNLLTDLDDTQLPGSLLILNITDNFVRTLNLVTCPNLEELWCNNNRIEFFKNLPKGLVKLYCNQNLLRHLDLRGLDKLKILHCSQNRLLKIENLPSNIHDFDVKDSPFALEIDTNTDSDSDDDTDNIDKSKKQESKKDIERKINYIDALNVYYQAKHNYEERLLKKRRIAYNKAPTKKMGNKAAKAVVANCIYCNRPVGTRFYTNKTGHFAVCGDNIAPCGLNIKLLRGMFDMKEHMLYMFKEDVEKEKENIIKHKLDTLFNYYSNEISVKKFKEFMENYSVTSSIYEDYLNLYNELFFNEQKKEAIHKKTNKINEILDEIRSMISDFSDNENPSVLKTAMELYIQDLQPEIENLRRLKYDIVEMEENKLIEMPASLHKLEHSTIEEPKVVHFKGL